MEGERDTAIGLRDEADEKRKPLQKNKDRRTQEATDKAALETAMGSDFTTKKNAWEAEEQTFKAKQAELEADNLTQQQIDAINLEITNMTTDFETKKLEFEKEDIKRKKAEDKQARFDKANEQDDEIDDQQMEFEYFQGKMDRLNEEIEFTELMLEDAIADEDEEYIEEVEMILDELYEQFEMDQKDLDDLDQTLGDIKFEQFNRQLMEAEEDIKYAREEYEWKLNEQTAKWDEFYNKQFEVDAMSVGQDKTDA